MTSNNRRDIGFNQLQHNYLIYNESRTTNFAGKIMIEQTAGARFRQALKEEQPLQIMGTINAYAAMMAEQVGYKAIYLSGGGVANASYGLPDLGMTSLDNVCEDIRRITSASSLPLLVDIIIGMQKATIASFHSI